MFLGHFAMALAAKRAAPRASLGTLTVAAQFIDLLWPPLLLAGVETAAITPGITRVTPLDFTSYPYSHSLLAVLLWGVLVGGAYFAWRRDRRAALVLGLLVLSHWLLDLLTHRPDLPLGLGEGSARVGLGLWNSMAGTILVEGGLFVLGAALYLRATRPLDRRGSIGAIAYLAVLALIYAVNLTSPPPPNVQAIGVAGLLLWLFPLWAWRFDRHRTPVEGGAQSAHVQTASVG